MNEQEPSSAKKYHAVKNRLFFVSLFLNLIFLAIFFLSGFSVYLRNQAGYFSSNLFLLNGFYILAFFLIFDILNFPLGFYEGFILEHKFNLSNQTFVAWLKDELKKIVLDFVLFLIVVEAVYFLLYKSPDYWWLFGALFWIFLTIVLAKITPAVIIPIFYKYIPIANNELRQRIFNLFERCKIKISDVTSINFSQKTKKANAFVAGLGKNKKVVLSDTLLEKFSLDEIEAVLAHELGHYLNHDILKLLLVNSIFSVFGFYIIDRLLNSLLSTFGIKAIDDIAFLPVVSLCLLLLGFLILPAQNWFSRVLEKKADIFSLELTKNKPAFISMMEKLGALNLADASPSRFIEIWFYNHPSISKRIKLAQSHKSV
jgi:STE24 endopeptidase